MGFITLLCETFTPDPATCLRDSAADNWMGRSISRRATNPAQLIHGPEIFQRGCRGRRCQEVDKDIEARVARFWRKKGLRAGSETQDGHAEEGRGRDR